MKLYLPVVHVYIHMVKYPQYPAMGIQMIYIYNQLLARRLLWTRMTTP